VVVCGSARRRQVNLLVVGRYWAAAALAAGVVLLACGPTRPEPNAPKDDWVDWCESRKETCELCAGEGNCGYCPETKTCHYYAQDDQSAKETCPGILKNARGCEQ
jgi:hypothetical protein